MTVTDQTKILDDKIKSNQAQYDWNREEAKTSALSSKTLLDKYEYFDWWRFWIQTKCIRES